MPISALSSQDGIAGTNKVRLAFAHQVHTNIAILEMTLAMLYRYHFVIKKQTRNILLSCFRPHNVHCIHVDAKAPPVVHESVGALAACYNARFRKASVFAVKVRMMDMRRTFVIFAIFTRQNPLPVYWAHMTNLDADLFCLRKLYENYPDWT